MKEWGGGEGAMLGMYMYMFMYSVYHQHAYGKGMLHLHVHCITYHPYICSSQRLGTS